MNPRKFFAELKRRNIYKVAVAYAIVGWLIMQVAATAVPALHLPDAVTSAVVLLTILGFPIALVLAWAFELTPEGIQRTDDVVPERSITRRTGRMLDFVIIGVLLVVIAFFIFERRHSKRTSATETTQKSIAVLPFENRSDDKANAYFADGIQGEILTRLSKIADLKVISRTSTQHYKSAPENLPEIARQLGVAHILEGSVQKSGDSVRVNVQLIKAANDSHIWAESFDRKLTDIFAVESDVAKTIADQLQIKLSDSERRAIVSRPTESNEAHDLYLKGRFFWNKRTADDIQKSIEYFTQAVGQDRGYALAYAGLADAYALLNYYGAFLPSETFPKARQAAEKALEIDETLAESHATIAYIKRAYDWDWAGAEREFKRAIELNPNYATAHFWYGEHLIYLARFEEGIAEIQRAEVLDPLSPIISGSVGWALHMARQPDRAIEQLQKTLGIDPNFSMTYFYLGMAYEGKGMYQQAIAAYSKAREISPAGPGIVGLGHAYAMSGMKDEAHSILNELKQRLGKHRPRPSGIAIVSAGLNDADGVFEWLERAHERRDEGVIYLKSQPYFDNVRSDPRRAAFLQRIGLN